jgi:hypothetical protein
MGSFGGSGGSTSNEEPTFDFSGLETTRELPAIDYSNLVGVDKTYTAQDYLDRTAPLGPGDARMLARDPRYANYLAYTNNGAFDYPFSDPYFAGFSTGGEANTRPDLSGYTPMSYAQWLDLANSFGNIINPPTPPVTPPPSVTPPNGTAPGNNNNPYYWVTQRPLTGTGASGSFMLNKPNMTWNNDLPSVIPSNGQEAYNKYAPFPFTREANTPGVTYNKPPLTYNNPYNTNPYLPTANPFALIANQSQAS